MQVSVTEVERKTMYGSEYVFVTLHTDKHAASVIVVSGHVNHVQVTVKNAAHRAWRGMGKRFPTVADAVAAYKTDAVRAMIQTAADIASAPV